MKDRDQKSEDRSQGDQRYRKKPVVVRAWQWTGEQPSRWPAWVFDYRHDDEIVVFNTSDGILLIPTLEGRMTARSGDWIIQGIQGELYPCKPDIFEATYERSDGPCGVVLIAAERRRQVDEEGWSAERDDLHTDGELAMAAALYAAPVPLYLPTCRPGARGLDDPFPWCDTYDKRDKHPRLRRLVIAGALLAAEIDRLLRLEAGSQDEDAQGPGLEWEP